MEQGLVHEQAAAYALDALADDEREAFERHLATCEQCRADIGGFRDAAALMAVDADLADPPPELRGRILDAARAERPNVVPLRRRAPARPLVWFATAAAAAAVVLAVWGGIKTHDLSNERSARQADRRALAVLADPNAQLTALKGGTGTLAVAPDGSAVLAVSQLAPAPSGKTYEAWVINGPKPVRAGLLRGGDGTSTVVLAHPVPKGAQVAVTVERSGGVDAPTTTPVITAVRSA